MTKIFLDTEFTGLNQNTKLISMALVSESNDKFYAEFTDYTISEVSDWIKTNVVNNLFLDTTLKLDNTIHLKSDTNEIVQQLKKWLHQFGAIQIWADVPHYDWVLFCELFGGALNIPKNIHYMPMDLATLLYVKGYDIDVKREELLGNASIPAKLNKHNALYDAIITKNCVLKLLDNE